MDVDSSFDSGTLPDGLLAIASGAAEALGEYEFSSVFIDPTGHWGIATGGQTTYVVPDLTAQARRLLPFPIDAVEFTAPGDAAVLTRRDPPSGVYVVNQAGTFLIESLFEDCVATDSYLLSGRGLTYVQLSECEDAGMRVIDLARQGAERVSDISDGYRVFSGDGYSLLCFQPNRPRGTAGESWLTFYDLRVPTHPAELWTRRFPGQLIFEAAVSFGGDHVAVHRDSAHTVSLEVLDREGRSVGAITHAPREYPWGLRFEADAYLLEGWTENSIFQQTDQLTLYRLIE